MTRPSTPAEPAEGALRRRRRPAGAAAPPPPRPSAGRLAPRDVAQLLAVIVLWALCYPLIEVGLASAPPLLFAAMRALVAGAVLVAAGIAAGKPLPRGWRLWLALAGVGLGITTLGFAGMFLAGNRVTPGLATVLSNSQPLLAALLGYFALGETLRRGRGLALGVGAAGIALIAVPGFAVGAGNSTPLGMGFVLAGAAGVAVGNVLLKRMAAHVSPLMAMGWQLLLGAVPLFIGAWALGAHEAVAWNPRFVLVLGVLAVLGTAAAFALWCRLLRRAELNRLNAFTFLTPVVALAIGAAFFSERLAPTEWLGTALIIASVVLASVIRDRAPARLAPRSRAG